MVVACISLTIALSGASYAAVTLPRNSVGTAQLKRNAVVSAKVKDGSLKRADFGAGEVPAGPQGPQGPAGQQGPEGPPNPNAVNAQNANLLDGIDSTGFMRANGVRVAFSEERQGPLPLTFSSFTTNGGRLWVSVSATGYKTSIGHGCFGIFFDGPLNAQRCHWFNQTAFHLTLATQTFERDAAAGSHTIRLDSFGGANALASDVNDIYDVTVLELP